MKFSKAVISYAKKIISQKYFDKRIIINKT